jgi:DNA-binding transcriptional regulator YiaG
MDIAQLRRKTGLNQETFYKKIAVTQSGGSRYESGRRVPGPVRLLLDIAYGTDRQAQAAVKKLRSK